MTSQTTLAWPAYTLILLTYKTRYRPRLVRAHDIVESVCLTCALQWLAGALTVLVALFLMGVGTWASIDSILQQYRSNIGVHPFSCSVN